MVVHSYYPVGEPRGEREARAAVQAGYDVDVICLRRDGEPRSETIEGVAITRLPFDHVRGAGWPRLVFEYPGFALMAAAAVMKVHRRSRIDVTYVHAPPDFLIATALIPRLIGSGVVLDIHDLSPHMFEARFGGKWSARIIERVLQFVERAACAVADRVVTVHTPYRDELVAHKVPSRKISVVMNAPDADILERARAGISEARSSDSFTVAYHGTVNYWYGVDLIVEAIARLSGRVPGLRGLILGEGDALTSTERLAREAGIGSIVEFSGSCLPQVEALRRVATASCGVIPNRRMKLNRFALSSKLLEYVALGIPAVVSRLETLEAHFGPDEVTFFEPGDPESLAEAIAWVSENPLQAREKAERAQRRAEQYSWSRSRAVLLEALSCVAS